MIKTLILEDDIDKLRRITSILHEPTFVDEVSVVVAADLNAARRVLRSTIFDLLILDINLPPRPGEPPQQGAGVAFLEELQRSATLSKPYHIIGLTAFDEALALADAAFAEGLWWVIKYDISSNEWEKRLRNKVDYLVDSHQRESQKNQLYDYDLAWVTALNAPEFQSVQRLDVDWNSKAVVGDSTEYLLGDVIAKDGKRLRIVAASAYQMGMPAASVLSMKLISHFRPRFIGITGIAAGVQGAANLGDILAAEHSWDYNSGKLSQNADETDYFSPDPKVLPLHTTLRERFARLASERKYLDDIRNAWPSSKPTTPLELRLGPLASGSAVIQNSRLIRQITEQSRKVVGIDMETYGVFYAAENAARPRPVPFALKSVCDFADNAKNDAYQSYAAFTSANYLLQFLVNDIPDLIHAI